MGSGVGRLQHGDVDLVQKPAQLLRVGGLAQDLGRIVGRSGAAQALHQLARAPPLLEVEPEDPAQRGGVELDPGQVGLLVRPLQAVVLEVDDGQHPLVRVVQDGRAEHAVLAAAEGGRAGGRRVQPRVAHQLRAAAGDHAADHRGAHALHRLAGLAGVDLRCAEAPAGLEGAQAQRLGALQQQEQRVLRREPHRRRVEGGAQGLHLRPVAPEHLEDGVQRAEQRTVIAAGAEHRATA